MQQIRKLRLYCGGHLNESLRHQFHINIYVFLSCTLFPLLLYNLLTYSYYNTAIEQMILNRLFDNQYFLELVDIHT